MVVIIGGGIFGLAIGWYLARVGCPVTLFEQGQVGRGATWAAAGMLMPWKISPSFNHDLFLLQQASHQLWPAFAQELKAASNVAIHYQTDGRYFVALDEKAVKRLRKQYTIHKQLDFPLRWLTGEAVRQREPYLSPKIQAAIFSSLSHRVDNRRLIKALREAFLNAGGKLREQTRVTAILTDRQQVRGLQLGEEMVGTDTVILAAGAWSGQIKGLPQRLQETIQPLKGQTLTLQMSVTAPLIRHPLIGPVYIVPRRDGRLIVGTTVEEEAGFNTSSTVGGVLQILTKAQQILPAIKELPIVEMGAGLRPTGPERLPVLGTTEIRGLVIASGGHSYGILLSPIVAQAINELVLRGRVIDIIKPFGLR